MDENDLSEMDDFVEKYKDMDRLAACADNPVVRREWGGENGTDLQIELYAPEFADGLVWVAIECGYVGLGSLSPQEFVEKNCSGLVYVAHHVEGNICNILMSVDADAVREDLPYPYMISGNGTGEYQVAVYSVTNIPADGDLSQATFRNLYFEDFCCK